MLGVMALRCLIVDDNPDVLRTASELLSSEGLTIVGVARNGDEAMELLRSALIDVALVDIDLGSESGLNLTRSLAQGAETSSVRTILISTHDEGEYADLIAESPALGFLSKADLSAASVCGLLRAGGEGRGPTEPRGTL